MKQKIESKLERANRMGYNYECKICGTIGVKGNSQLGEKIKMSLPKCIIINNKKYKFVNKGDYEIMIRSY